MSEQNQYTPRPLRGFWLRRGSLRAAGKDPTQVEGAESVSAFSAVIRYYRDKNFVKCPAVVA